MKYLKQHYREIVDLLQNTDAFTRLLKLKTIPHFTTLQKFFKRFSQLMFDRILCQSLKLFQLSVVGIAIDATGYDSDYSSKYYSAKIKGSCFRKSYTKDSIAIDVKTQAILANKSCKAPRHDNKDFRPLIKRVCKQLKIDYVSADKAYDDKSNREFLNEKGIRANIHIRRFRHNKTSRLKHSMSVDENEYHQRSKVETVFSVIKRKFGSAVYSRIEWLKMKEIKLKNIVYNIYRKIKLDSKSCTTWIFVEIIEI